MKKSNQKMRKINWAWILIRILLVVLFFYITVLFVQWNFTLYHEKGHLDMCETLNLNCTFNSKSFQEYISFVNDNILIFNQLSVEMSVNPENITYFCNLKEPQKQLIRIAGFRNDLKIILLFSGLSVIELFIFLWIVYFHPFKNKKIRHYVIILCISLIALTLLLLFGKIVQLQNYFSKNIGDLFYYPCS